MGQSAFSDLLDVHLHPETPVASNEVRHHYYYYCLT